MEYVSPKLLKKFENTHLNVPGNNSKDDVYSLGRTLLETLSFYNKNTFKKSRPSYNEDCEVLKKL